MGFPQVSCPGILNFVQRWDDIEVDWAAGVVRNLTQSREIASSRCRAPTARCSRPAGSSLT